MPIVTLTHGNFSAGLLPELGGVLTHFASSNGKGLHHWLRPAPADIASPLQAACYPMLPFFSRLSDNALLLDGERYPLPPAGPGFDYPLHGFGWFAHWDIVDQTTSRAVLQHRHDAGAWPFDYRATLTASLDDTGLALQLDLVNNSPRAMPAGLGFHPFFANHPGARLKAGVSAMHQMGVDGLPESATRSHPALTAFADGAHLPSGLNTIFEGWTGSAIIETTNGPLALLGDPPFEFLCVYSPAGQEFFCVEPVTHTANAFHLGRIDWGETGDRRLMPGEIMSARCAFHPLAPG